MHRSWQDALKRVASATARTPKEQAASEALWAMTPEERVAAMWRGELSLMQCLEWSRRAPEEVPRLNGEFAYITLNTVEYLEAEDQPKCPATDRGVRECRCGSCERRPRPAAGRPEVSR